MAPPHASATPGRSLWRDREFPGAGVSTWRGQRPGPRPRESLSRLARAVAHGSESDIMGTDTLTQFFLLDHELSKVRHGSRPALVPLDEGRGGNSATTI